MAKTYKNTKKGRNKIPKKPGAYNLKDKGSKTTYTGSSKNVHGRIAEHHRDPNMHFSSLTITQTSTKSQAKGIEKTRIKHHKPPKNKTKK